jgi:hypothetical protein
MGRPSKPAIRTEGRASPGAKEEAMPITLVFRGGFFTDLPGCGESRKVDVHMRMPEQVKVTDSNKKRDTTLENALSSASRIDFISKASLKPAILPIRRLSHLIPIDYHGFHKTVSFTGGTVTGSGKAVPRPDLMRITAAKKRADRDEMLVVFKRYNRVTSDDHDQEFMRGMVQEFFSRANAKELRTWRADYCIEVKIPTSPLTVLRNGRQANLSISNGTKIEFPVDPTSTIPHYPLNNPHVMERPPTR